MGVVKLYGDLRSPCVRAALFVVKEINLQLELIELDLMKNEQLSPNFLQINPRHTVPTLDDNGFILWDSHAIMIYLVEKYGQDSTLYPKDFKKRANINRLLFFDAGEIFASHIQICRHVLGGKKEEPLERLKKNFEDLEAFLQNSKCVAGDEMTIADISIWTTISNAQCWLPLVKEKYPKIVAWKSVMDSLPYADINFERANMVIELVKTVRLFYLLLK